MKTVETHFFNEQTKRLESIGTMCVYCGKTHATDKSSNCTLTLYKEKSRTNVVVYRNVKFSKIEIEATRCPNCKNIHRTIKLKSILYSTFCFLLVACFIALFSWFMFPIITIFAIVLGMLLLGIDFCLVNMIWYDRFEEKFIRKYQILTPKQGMQRYPIVKSLIQNGFTFNEPIA